MGEEGPNAEEADDKPDRAFELLMTAGILLVLVFVTAPTHYYPGIEGSFLCCGIGGALGTSLAVWAVRIELRRWRRGVGSMMLVGFGLLVAACALLFCGLSFHGYWTNIERYPNGEFEMPDDGSGQ